MSIYPFNFSRQAIAKFRARTEDIIGQNDIKYFMKTCNGPVTLNGSENYTNKNFRNKSNLLAQKNHPKYSENVAGILRNQCESCQIRQTTPLNINKQIQSSDIPSQLSWYAEAY
jgi:hypothetical protein